MRISRTSKQIQKALPPTSSKDQSKRNARAPVRVLIVAPSLDIIGGQSVQANRLLEALAREQGLEVSFQPHNPRLPRPLRFLQRVKYLRTLSTSLLYCAMLLARAWRYDVIHTFSAAYFSYFLAALPALLVAKLYGKKAVLNYRSGEAEDHLARWPVARATMRMADEVVVPSGYLVEVFARRGLRARAIYNIVELDRFRFRLRHPLRPVLMSNRNLVPMYNVGCILRAFSLIQRRYPDARLIVAGDGCQGRELKELTRQLGLRNTKFISYVHPRSMPKLYGEADIFLNSSEIDNMPGSIIESFASGLPVVTTDAGGIPHILTHEETGLMVGRGDYKAMADCVFRLLEDEGLASRISRRAHEGCLKYTWPEVRKDWINLYTEMAREKAQFSEEKAVGKAAARMIITRGEDKP